MNNTLLEQIDALVASKTFSLDALDSIKKIKDDFQKTLGSLEYSEMKLVDANKNIASMTSELARERAKVTALEANIKVNETLVAEGQKAIWEKKIAEGVASAYMHSMEIVFKPATVRETVTQRIPISQSNNGNTYVNTYEQKTETTKEEL